MEVALPGEPVFVYYLTMKSWVGFAFGWAMAILSRVVYHATKRSWTGIAVGWVIAALALGGAAMLPGPNIDLYFKDRYVIVSKLSLLVGVGLVLVLPLAVATIRRARVTR
ncbi:MAG TPA: hypothetical protein VL371_02155 [Gemmataceae bacterium]|jgi:hypothetical protein|nr:hypothetical protein [Gemmataceae bacterium]